MTIIRITHPCASVAKQLRHLIMPHVAMLALPGQSVEELVENALSHAPYLWLAYTPEGKPVAACYLDELIPGRSAYLHGCSVPVAGLSRQERRDLLALKTELGNGVIAFAFSKALGLKTLYARFDASNRGARGFCWRMGFMPVETKEGFMPIETEEGFMPMQTPYHKNEALWVFNKTSSGG
jgi:hypothetical protein